MMRSKLPLVLGMNFFSVMHSVLAMDGDLSPCVKECLHTHEAEERLKNCMPSPRRFTDFERCQESLRISCDARCQEGPGPKNRSVRFAKPSADSGSENGSTSDDDELAAIIDQTKTMKIREDTPFSHQLGTEAYNDDDVRRTLSTARMFEESRTISPENYRRPQAQRVGQALPPSLSASNRTTPLRSPWSMTDTAGSQVSTPSFSNSDSSTPLNMTDHRRARKRSQQDTVNPNENGENPYENIQSSENHENPDQYRPKRPNIETKMRDKNTNGFF